MSWWDGRMCAFDLETTAPDPEEARIVTAAVARVGGGGDAVTATWLADPGVEIPEGATEVHGITTEHAQEHGRPTAEVVAEVVDALVDGLAGGEPLVIFNARYDLTVLDRECRRLAFPTLVERLDRRDVPLRVVDPLIIDKWLHRYRRGSRKLDAQCEHYGATLDEAHEAAADAIAAARLAWCIGKRGIVVRRVRGALDARQKRALEREWDEVRGDLQLLHEAQIRWAREQADGLAAYFQSQGNPDWETVRRELPVVPIEAAVA